MVSLSCEDFFLICIGFLDLRKGIVYLAAKGGYKHGGYIHESKFKSAKTAVKETYSLSDSLSETIRNDFKRI